jgi:anti-anti-sigma factor
MQQIGDNVSLEHKDNVSIIHICNNLSYQTADELRDAYDQIQDGKLLFDLAGVRVTTSRGVATLISIMLESYDKGRQVCLCDVSSMCMTIIEVTEIMKHVPSLKIFDTLDEGLEYLRDL